MVITRPRFPEIRIVKAERLKTGIDYLGTSLPMTSGAVYFANVRVEISRELEDRIWRVTLLNIPTLFYSEHLQDKICN